MGGNSIAIETHFTKKVELVAPELCHGGLLWLALWNLFERLQNFGINSTAMIVLLTKLVSDSAVVQRR
jgi:hypothetical protein